MKFKLILFISCVLCIVFALNSCGEHKHEKAEDIQHDDSHHWYTCTDEGCNELLEKEEHKWNDGKITIEPTPTKEGVKTYVCTVCKTVKTEFVQYQSAPTVTKAQWESAFSVSNFSNATIDFSEAREANGKNHITKYHIESEGSKLYLTIKTFENDKQISYYGKYQENELIWEFDSEEKTIEETSQTIGVGNISSVSKLLSDNGLELGGLYDSFVYNEKTKSYDASNIKTEKMSFKSVSVSVNEGKLLKIVAVTNEAVPTTVEMNFSSYGTTKATPPRKSNNN